MWEPPADHPLRRLFAGLTEHTFLTRLGLADPPLIDYLSTLLSRFVHTDAVHRLKGQHGRPLQELALMVTEAEALGIGTASSAEIDERNIYWASQMAMKRALASLPGPVDFLLVDGHPLKEVQYRQMGIPQGDRKSVSIAAASIVAKVFRDGLMEAFDGIYAGYGLARNKGYGTDEHFRSLRDRGPTGLHRMSFKLG